MSRPGLHWPNTTAVDLAARARFMVGRFPWCVMLDVTPASEARWVLSQGAQLVVRLYEGAPFGLGELPDPAAFVDRHYRWIGTVDPRGYYQILNEPDVEYPSVPPATFAAWWRATAARLRQAFPGIRLGFPAPSIGAADSYLDACAPAIAEAAFIGERGYWQPRALMTDRRWGWRWLRSAGFGKPVFLTEYGCSDPNAAKEDKALQYLDYGASLPRWIVPAGAFIGAGGDPAWDTPAHGRLWIDDAMCAALGWKVGTREEVALAVDQVLGYAALIAKTARNFSLQPAIVAGLIDVESGGIEHATSPDNGPGLGHALGLMQVLEGNFTPGQNGYDPETNLVVGCRILRQKIDAYGGRLESGLAAYFGAVDAAGNPTDGHDLTGTTGKQYVAEVRSAAQHFAELDHMTTPGTGDSAGALADDDFKQYAPQTGTWREACINLKGIADKALRSGREIVADLTACADHAVAEWGGQ